MIAGFVHELLKSRDPRLVSNVRFIVLILLSALPVCIIVNEIYLDFFIALKRILLLNMIYIIRCIWELNSDTVISPLDIHLYVPLSTNFIHGIFFLLVSPANCYSLVILVIPQADDSNMIRSLSVKDLV